MSARWVEDFGKLDVGFRAGRSHTWMTGNGLQESVEAKIPMPGYAAQETAKLEIPALHPNDRFLMSD